ncbi:MAG: PIG-L family deacetylase [Actinomycetota bacterium]|nr:PIG-L family deacetylase [Actinomycetota bacterium]
MPVQPTTPPVADHDAAALAHHSAGWDRVVARATPWRPPSSRTVVVAPHPDDEVLGCGGLVAHQRRRGVEVVVVAVTDGEAAYPDRRQELAEIRRAEQRRALEALGVGADAVVRLGLPDGGLANLVAELTDELRAIVQPSDLVVAPWTRDHHSDHIACGRAATAAADEVGAEAVGTLFWAYHFTDPDTVERADDPTGDGVSRFGRLDLDTELIERRAVALGCHGSQLPGGDVDDTVLDAGRLAPLDRNVELYARNG